MLFLVYTYKIVLNIKQLENYSLRFKDAPLPEKNMLFSEKRLE